LLEHRCEHFEICGIGRRHNVDILRRAYVAVIADGDTAYHQEFDTLLDKRPEDSLDVEFRHCLCGDQRLPPGL
jgi:hypothetical protein